MGETNYVWEFTNQRKLNKKEFLHYVEKKVFKTIRKYGMLPEDRKIVLKDDGLLNTEVLKHILSQKFAVEHEGKANFASESLTDAAEMAFKNILKGDFVGIEAFDGKIRRPLIDLTDKEIEKYAELLDIKGEKKERDEKVSKLFETFKKKNPDLDHNIVNAMAQIQEVQE